MVVQAEVVYQIIALVYFGANINILCVVMENLGEDVVFIKFANF